MTETKAYGSSWYAATIVDSPARPPLASDLDVDVCVIGGGLAGLTVAREVARSGWSVVVLEARRLASSASGRNTGFVLPGFAADPERLIARVGFEHTQDLWALSEAGLDYVRRTVREEPPTPADAGIETADGWLYVSKLDNADEFARSVQLLRELGCEVEAWPTERVRAVLRSNRYFQAINYLRAITIHPLNYALKLAAAAERDGARIFEETPALAIDPTGVRKRIVTPSARVRATQVVLAGNVQLGGLIPRVAATLIPITTYVMTTERLGPRLAEAVGYRGAVSDTDLADNHYRIVGGDRLMWSGRSTVWQRNPTRYRAALTRDIRRTYPQLGKVAVDFAWAGTLGNTIHRMPQIGELGPGVWLASGFGGHGLNTTAMAGNLVARGIVEGDQTWRQFTPFELVWAGGFLGRAAVQMRVLIKRLRDAAAGRRARARDAARRRKRKAAGPVPDAFRNLDAPAGAEELTGALPSFPPLPEPPPMDDGVAEAAPELSTAPDPELDTSCVANAEPESIAPPPSEIGEPRLSEMEEPPPSEMEEPPPSEIEVMVQPEESSAASPEQAPAASEPAQVQPDFPQAIPAPAQSRQARRRRRRRERAKT